MGKPISQLEPLELPIQPADLIEVSRLEEGTWRSFKAPALSAYVGQATTTSAGIAELATPAETIAGEDAERVVTPAGLEAAIQDVLQNRIVQGDGISLTYNSGILTVSVA